MTVRLTPESSAYYAQANREAQGTVNRLVEENRELRVEAQTLRGRVRALEAELAELMAMER